MRSLSCFLAAVLLSAQTPSRVQTGYDAIRASRLKADLTFLSSDALDGRRSLDRGSEIAIQWIAGEFSKAGLKPAAGESYLQPVPLFEYSMDRELTGLTLVRGGRSETFRSPDAVANTPREGTIAGQVVFAGFGITAPELSYDDYAGIDAKGKIVLVFNHEPQENDRKSVFNGKGVTRYTNYISKLRNAQRHGAVAVLTMPDPNHPATPRSPGPARGRPGIEPPEAAYSLRATDRWRPRNSHLFALGARLRCPVRRGREAAGGGANPIDAKLAPASFEIPNTRIELRTATSERRRLKSYNVAGLIEGSDPALRAETIIFSGHFRPRRVGPAGDLSRRRRQWLGHRRGCRTGASICREPREAAALAAVRRLRRRGAWPPRVVLLRREPAAAARIHAGPDQLRHDRAVVTDISDDTSNELGLIGTHHSPDYRESVERHNKTVGPFADCRNPPRFEPRAHARP